MSPCLVSLRLLPHHFPFHDYSTLGFNDESVAGTAADDLKCTRLDFEKIQEQFKAGHPSLSASMFCFSYLSVVCRCGSPLSPWFRHPSASAVFNTNTKQPKGRLRSIMAKERPPHIPLGGLGFKRV